MNISNKKLVVAVFLGVAVLVYILWFAYISSQRQDISTTQDSASSTKVLSYKDATYMIEDRVITLKDGVSELSIPDTSSKLTTRYFGNEAYADFDGDGREDVVFLLTQDGSGSGTFFYVAVALNTTEGYVGTRAFFIGDRIAPQTTEVNEQGHIIVNYAERVAGEPMTTPPFVGVSRHLIFDVANAQLGEVVQNFEGEADPALMKLDMKTWVLQKSALQNSDEILHNTNAFTLTFSNDGTVAIGSDCNQMSGTYKIEDSGIRIIDIQATLMYCSETQETNFVNALHSVTNYHFTSRGELVLGTSDAEILFFQ